MPSTHKWPPPPAARSSRQPREDRGSSPATYDSRTHPSYNLGRGFVPLDSTGARKKYVKAPV